MPQDGIPLPPTQGSDGAHSHGGGHPILTSVAELLAEPLFQDLLKTKADQVRIIHLTYMRNVLQQAVIAYDALIELLEHGN